MFALSVPFCVSVAEGVMMPPPALSMIAAVQQFQRAEAAMDCPLISNVPPFA